MQRLCVQESKPQPRVVNTLLSSVPSATEGHGVLISLRLSIAEDNGNRASSATVPSTAAVDIGVFRSIHPSHTKKPIGSTD